MQDIFTLHIYFGRGIKLDYVLKVENLSKKYNGVQALDKVNFNLKKGEIHGLIGANGSGKSTFMNILFGSRVINETGGYEGDIWIDNKKIDIKDSYIAMKQGIGMVHQELALLEDLSVSSNIKINKENIVEQTKALGKFALVDEKQNQADARLSLSQLGIELNPRVKVKSLSTNLRQYIEIAREIDKKNLKILILDEPTASLNVEETKVLLSNLKDIVKKGLSIIFISHRLEEVAEICHRTTILRDGKIVGEYKKKDYDINKMAKDMVGKTVIQALKEKREVSEKTILSFTNVEVAYGHQKYKNISLDIKQGEILGITGLAGQGQEIFGYGLMGLYHMDGIVRYNNQKIIPGHTNFMVKEGIYLLTDERKETGLILNKSIWENLVFESYDKQDKFMKYPRLKKLSLLDHKLIKEYSEGMVDKLNIKIRNINQDVGELSGGNQQKVCIGRAITINPDILFIGEPTRGIDVYSKEIILDLLLKLNREQNTTIVISSGEISELKRICDRIVVMYRNQVFKIFDDNFETEEFNLALSGRGLDIM